MLACPPSASYKLRKFVKRNRAGVIAASLVGAAVVLGMAGTTWGMLWALDERAQVTAQADTASQAMRDAARWLWFEAGIAVELAAAASIAALMTGAVVAEPGERVCALICGAGSAGMP